MAAAVMSPMSSLSLDREIMPPSPVSQNFSRHGRSRHGGSVVKGKARGRGYSIVDDREVTISKALSWVLKRTVHEDEEQEGEEKLVADAEGWVDCEEVLERPNLSALQVTFAELQALISSPASKARFSIKLDPDNDSTADSTDPSSYLIRANPSTKEPTSPTTAAAPTLTPLTAETSDLPDLIVYETTYANYPLILASNGIKRAGGQPHLSFSSIKVSEDGTEIRTASDADVSIYIDLRAAIEQDPKITWSRSDSGAVVTEGDVKGVISKAFWKKVVARRTDIGVLFEDGEVKKEVPIGLRGKGAKPKKGGKGANSKKIKEMKARSEDEDSTSD